LRVSANVLFYLSKTGGKEMALTQKEKEEINKARREYKKEWRKKNPDKVRAANERYWLKKAAQKKQQEGS